MWSFIGEVARFNYTLGYMWEWRGKSGRKFWFVATYKPPESSPNTITNVKRICPHRVASSSEEAIEKFYAWMTLREMGLESDPE